MATTNLYAIHAGKDGDALKAVKRVIGYVENPDKTEKKKLITSYECDPRTAAEEFMLEGKIFPGMDIPAWLIYGLMAAGLIALAWAEHRGYRVWTSEEKH